MSDRHPQSAQWLMARTHMHSAERHFGNAWKIHASPAPGGSETTKDYAFMHAAMCGHTSMESSLLAVFKTLGEPIAKDSDGWHRAVVVQAGSELLGRPPIIPPHLLEAMDETRRARNLAARGYDGFDIDKASDTAKAAKLLSECLMTALNDFIETVDPPSDKQPSSPKPRIGLTR